MAEEYALGMTPSFWRPLSDPNATSDQPRQEISVTLPDGAVKTGTSWETSPMDVAKEISKGLADRVVIAKVDGELWDLERPLEGSCKLELLDFEHTEGTCGYAPYQFRTF